MYIPRRATLNQWGAHVKVIHLLIIFHKRNVTILHIVGIKYTVQDSLPLLDGHVAIFSKFYKTNVRLLDSVVDDV